MAKSNSWIKPRHGIIRNTLAPGFKIFIKNKYHVDIEPFREVADRPFLIMMNHQTPGDQFFVSISCPKPVYYVATEDLFSNGWISKALSWSTGAIPIKKSTTDIKAVRNCMRVAREGGSIAIAPEGNRTYSGRTESIKPSIVKLVRALKLPIAFYIIDGGYGIEPRWADGPRKGSMKAGVKKVMEYDEYKDMTDEELYKCICDELFVDESEDGRVYISDHAAEYIERVLYVCPECGMSVFKSSGSSFTCTKCKKLFTYNEDKTISGSPFRNVRDWYDYQNSFVCRLDMEELSGTIVYKDTVDISEVIPYDRKNPLYSGAVIEIYGDRFCILAPKASDAEPSSEERMTFSLADIESMAAMGRNKLNIYTGEHIYQIRGDKRFNPVKYMNLFYRYNNQRRGENTNDQFLGL